MIDNSLKADRCSERYGQKIYIPTQKRLVLCRREATKLYATVDLDKARVGRTRLIENKPSNPCWNESFLIYCAHTVSEVVFMVKDDNPIGATLIGGAYLPVTDIISGYVVIRWIQILDEDHVPVHGGSRIHVRLQFLNVTRDSNWSQGIKNLFGEVPRTFFMQRKGCRVTLYQDAHVPDFYLSGDFKTEQSQADMFDPRLQAKILNVVDVSYGGENGFNQAIELSSEILSNVKFIQEKRLMGKYFEEISQDTGKYVFGVEDMLKTLEMGAVETLIVWENLDINRRVLKNTTSGEIVIKHMNKEQDSIQSNFRDPETSVESEVQEKMSLL
ncbi:phospholipase D alpha 1-like [Rhododendron vialii]|uniref:phospholipase D alpha 1-like n=1 Tax=Rhododendron vialii TaxID=182163 RepID=UPI0026604CAA|nr:phospholipase D alpha 1-like [Rhododendron vialii]